MILCKSDIPLSHLKPQGVIEVAEGINIDVTEDGKIVGIELLDASEKIQLDTLLTYEIAAESIREWIQSRGEATASTGEAAADSPPSPGL